MARTGKSLAELAAVMTIYPQVMVNVQDVDHHRLAGDETIAAAVGVAEAAWATTAACCCAPRAPSRSCG